MNIQALRAMVAAGASAEMLLAVLEAEHAVRSDRRDKDAARKRVTRASTMSARTNADSADSKQAIEAGVPATTSDGGARLGAAHNSNGAATAKKEGPHTPKEKLLPLQDYQLELINEGKKVRLRNPRARGGILPPDWQPSLDDVAYGLSLGLSRDETASAAEEMRLWAHSNEHRDVARKSNWSKAFKAWMRRNRGQGPPRPNGFGGHPQRSNGHAQTRTTSGFHSNLIDYAAEQFGDGLGADFRPGEPAGGFRQGY